MTVLKGIAGVVTYRVVGWGLGCIYIYTFVKYLLLCDTYYALYKGYHVIHVQ